jgi:GNAT superfamily N-acetyltransferase
VGDIDKLMIRRASAGDLPALSRALGQRYFFADRLQRQEEGRGVLLVAWLDGVPVGDVYVWLEEPEEPEIRERLPGVPLLNHFEVHPAWQNRGIGTRIIGAAEELIAAGGGNRVALGVHPDNEDAMRLYERRGYVTWLHPDVETLSEEFLDTGERQRTPEKCRVLVKDLDKVITAPTKDQDGSP